MKYNNYGQVIATTQDLCNLLYKDPGLDLSKFLVEDPAQFNHSIRALHYDTNSLREVGAIKTSIDEFDQVQQSHWYMPKEYRELDIAKWLLDQCQTPDELQRVGQELLLYQERDLFTLLQYLKYLIDTLRKHHVVWGVGRGSSVASYVLYLLGVHKINSIKYELEIDEFLK
jgi:hypothetical protein